MAPSTSTTACRPADVGEQLHAATAVFGALELLAEFHTSATTREEIRAATHAAHLTLARVGMTRDDLLDPALRKRALHAVGERAQPPPDPAAKAFGHV